MVEVTKMWSYLLSLQWLLIYLSDTLVYGSVGNFSSMRNDRKYGGIGAHYGKVSFGPQGNLKFHQSNRMYGGIEANLGQFPYMVAIVHFDGTISCGGALITNYHVLSAAHCVSDGPNYVRSLRLAAGLIDLCPDKYEDETIFKQVQMIESYLIHEYYQEMNNAHGKLPLENDIALIKARSPFSFNKYVAPASLPTDSLGDKERCIITGWGMTFNLPSVHIRLVHEMTTSREYKGFQEYNKSLHDGYNGFPCLLRVGIVRTYTDKQCFSIFQESFIPTSHVCAGYSNSDQFNYRANSCAGDSGSPMVCRGVIQGVVSFGIANRCTPMSPMPAVFTKIYNYLEWILENIPKM